MNIYSNFQVYGWAPARRLNGEIIPESQPKHTYAIGMNRLPFELLRMFWSSVCISDSCSRHRTSMWHTPSGGPSDGPLTKRVQAIFLDLTDKSLTHECKELIPKSSAIASWEDEEFKIRGNYSSSQHTSTLMYLQCGPIASPQSGQKKAGEAPCGSDEYGNKPNALGNTYRNGEVYRGYLLFREVYEDPRFDIVNFYGHCMAGMLRQGSDGKMHRINSDPLFNASC